MSVMVPHNAYDQIATHTYRNGGNDVSGLVYSARNAHTILVACPLEEPAEADLDEDLE